MAEIGKNATPIMIFLIHSMWAESNKWCRLENMILSPGHWMYPGSQIPCKTGAASRASCLCWRIVTQSDSGPSSERSPQWSTLSHRQLTEIESKRG